MLKTAHVCSSLIIKFVQKMERLMMKRELVRKGTS
jgi:hypothetical protein